jgi:hypothetical protein
MKKAVILGLFFFFAFSIVPCFAGPVMTFSGNSYGTHGYTQTVGWKFTVINTITVTDFYWFDPTKSLTNSYPVDIWRVSNSAVMASAGCVGYGCSGGSYDNADGYWDTPISSVILLPGDYVIGGLINPGDPIASQLTGINTDPNIQYVQSAAVINGTLTIPGYGQGYNGYLGPNFGIGTSTVPDTVPEPTTMLLLGLGLIGLAGVRRKFKN